MRVIAGKARSIPLKTLKGIDTRPTSDRTKETLFNVLQSELSHGDFLDMFSGSGAIGIEALSRGARHCVFIEHNPKAVACIKENLQKTKLMEQSQVIKQDVLFALEQLRGQLLFECIFIDPPYNLEWEKKILYVLNEIPLLSPDGIVIVEASLETDFSYLSETGFYLWKEKKYKTNRHLFLRRVDFNKGRELHKRSE